MPIDLAVTRVGADDAPRTIVMLHGIYGRGRNWQAIARALVAARSDYACVLIDLPHHGDSRAGAGSDTVEGQAADVMAWLDAQSVVPDAILGHSFGGKVALAMARAWPDRPLQIWVIDSTPETREPSGSAWQMLQTIRGLPSRFATRDELVAALTAAGWSPGVAQWMATNLMRDGDGFVWRLDFDAMERLLGSFFTTDLWSVAEQPSPHHAIHFIKASESSAMSDQAFNRVKALQHANVTIHLLDGGHWIHAEQPQAIVDLLARTL